MRAVDGMLPKGYARATAGKVPILVLCPAVDRDAGGGNSRRNLGRGGGDDRVLTAAYCAVMMFLARKALAELKGKFSELWSQTSAIMAATMVMTVVVLILGGARGADAGGFAFGTARSLFFRRGSDHGATLFAIGSRVITEGAEVLGWILRPRRADS